MEITIHTAIYGSGQPCNSQMHVAAFCLLLSRSPNCTPPIRPHRCQQVQCAFCHFLSRSPSCIPTNSTAPLPTSTMRFLPFCFQVTKLYTHQCDHTAANKYNALFAFFFPSHQIAHSSIGPHCCQQVQCAFCLFLSRSPNCTPPIRPHCCQQVQCAFAFLFPGHQVVYPPMRPHSSQQVQCPFCLFFPGHQIVHPPIRPHRCQHGARPFWGHQRWDCWCVVAGAGAGAGVDVWV